METIRQNIKVGFRNLSRSPVFTVAVTLTLALGIGLSIAVFSVAEALLLRRLPFEGQDRVVRVAGHNPALSFDNYPLSLEDGREFARQSRVFTAVALVGYEGASPKPVRHGEGITYLNRALVSGNFFSVLGVLPVRGRVLTKEDDVSGADPTLVLSFNAWQHKFFGDSTIVGRRILMYEEGETYTVAGVLPPGADYPEGADAWAPMRRATPPDKTDFVAVYPIGRLGGNSTPEDAVEEVTAFFRRPAASPWQRDFAGTVQSIPRIILGDVRTAVIAFAAASALLLIVTCVNVANLLLIRSHAKVREIAIRSALGAERRRIASLLLTENALVAGAGGLCGLAFAKVAIPLFIAFAPANLPRVAEIGVNREVLVAAIVITGLAMLSFSLAPIILSARVELQDVLRLDQRQSPSRRSRLVTESLVVGQVALALVLLSGAGLIVRSLMKLERADLVLKPTDLLIAELAFRAAPGEESTNQVAVIDHVLSRLQGTPGVVAASPIVAAPFAGSRGWDMRLAADGQTSEEATASNPMLNVELVAPGYFSALELPLVRGRGFSEADRSDAPPVAIVSQSAARHYWPGADPIGQRLRMGADLERSVTVVGVVPDTRFRDMRVARPSVYFPLHQSFFPFSPKVLAIRTMGDRDAVVRGIRNALSQIDSRVELVTIAPFRSYLDVPLGQPRLNALLLSVFAAAAALLAAVGMFGTMLMAVRQRTREMGVRMALGASGSDLQLMVVRRGLVLAGIGATLGLAGALITNRLLVAMLYNVTPSDPGTLVTVTLVITSLLALASLLPARSATRIDITVALRTDA